jgi:hypothetical protein
LNPILFWLLLIAKDITTTKLIIESPPHQRKVDRVLLHIYATVEDPFIIKEIFHEQARMTRC